MIYFWILKRSSTMQIDMNSDIKYYTDDEKTHLSYFEYKKGDYISDNELYKLFSYVYGRVHSTGGNFYILECSMGNKNNKRFIVADKMYYNICDGDKLKQYASSDIDPPRFTRNDLQKKACKLQ
jgi:hypothetical protein